MFSFCLGRDNLVERFKRIPVPNSDPPSFRHVSDLVREYFALFEGPAASQSETPLPPSPLEVLLKIDACLLRMFDFPPRLEKRLLDFFRGEQRAGVPFEFKSYYPPDFKPAIPLHLYLSSEFQESTAGQFRDRWKPGELSSVIEALDFAVEAYR
jgi:hypothetical protein